MSICQRAIPGNKNLLPKLWKVEGLLLLQVFTFFSIEEEWQVKYFRKAISLFFSFLHGLQPMIGLG
jgi:hypothetical protein